MWDGIGDFLTMGGHAAYVWGSFGMVAAVLLIEWLLVGRRRRRLQAMLQRQSQRSTAAQSQGD
ncbi:heme exporter protein CcmD [Halorhodospira halophila]|uniref:Heme exporter protein D n=1 Tax=Halorhodospira halophila (strain DSM 244 / SL1) TaxID=349124 RepID=A1WWS2_HALHL|nr:heme exporter protein CcmD [Halorhodospira halophila]ABM62134.1 heme exporter protein D [Halorhodospira halophila SL1]MBK1729462.1 heme exporter protein CcmD [Halorhodospira halophila]